MPVLSLALLQCRVESGRQMNTALNSLLFLKACKLTGDRNTDVERVQTENNVYNHQKPGGEDVRGDVVA